MAVPPVVAPSTLTVGCAAALAVIVAFVLCVPMFSGDEQPGTDTADSSQSSPAAATYPADLLLDRAGSKDVSRRPVLIERSGTRTTLPAGGGVHVAVRTPGGWLVKRTVAGRDYELLHIVDGSEPRQIARGTGLSFWVHDSGKRVVVDLRGAQSGVRVLALDTGAEQSGTLPTAVKIIDWIGDLVLVRLPRPDAPEQPAAADFRLDRWNPSKPYESTPGETGGLVWGIADGLVLTYEPATGCSTLAVPATRFAPARPPRCDLPFDIDLRVLDGNWSGLSPDGRTVALPGARGVPAFIPLDDLFGTGTPRSVTGIDHGVSELRWRDNGEVVVLEAGGAGRLTVCGSGTATCSAAETPTRDGFDLTQLAIRVGAG